MNQKTAKLINRTARKSVNADPRIAEEDKQRAFKTASRQMRKAYASTPKKFREGFKRQLKILDL